MAGAAALDARMPREPPLLAAACEPLPLSGVMTLVRAGWTGGAETGDLLRARATTLAWIMITVFAVRTWFRWAPRRWERRTKSGDGPWRS